MSRRLDSPTAFVQAEQLAQAIEACIDGRMAAAIEIGDGVFLRAETLVSQRAPDVLRSIRIQRRAA